MAYLNWLHLKVAVDNDDDNLSWAGAASIFLVLVGVRGERWISRVPSFWNEGEHTSFFGLGVFNMSAYVGFGKMWDAENSF